MMEELWSQEACFQLQVALLLRLLHQGLLKEREFEEAKELLVKKYDPPITRLSLDIEK